MRTYAVKILYLLAWFNLLSRQLFCQRVKIGWCMSNSRSYCKTKEEALLLQTDRAMRYVSQYLVNYCTAAGTSCTANPQQIAVMELEGYSWSTCSKQPRLVDCRIGVVNKLDRRRVCWQRDRLAVEENSRVKCVYLSRYPNFYHAMLCIRGTSHGPVSVCPSVCLSVTSRSST